eukprot:gene5637-8959_t
MLRFNCQPNLVRQTKNKTAVGGGAITLRSSHRSSSCVTSAWRGPSCESATQSIISATSSVALAVCLLAAPLGMALPPPAMAESDPTVDLSDDYIVLFMFSNGEWENGMVPLIYGEGIEDNTLNLSERLTDSPIGYSDALSDEVRYRLAQPRPRAQAQPLTWAQPPQYCR